MAWFAVEQSPQTQLHPSTAGAKGAPPAMTSDPSRLFLTQEQQREATPLQGFPVGLKSLLKVPARMQYGDYLWNDGGVPKGPIEVRVDLRTQILSVFRGGHEIGTAVVLYGADEKETPLGSFPILWKGKDHRSSLYDAPMPYTLRLTGDGVAIHGSDVRWGAATHGCVGVPKSFAAHLFAQAKVGDVVTIVRTTAPRS
ncbi:L,D-transpeptidase family protein [Sphingomonas arenae]|uniref:L,D-transpeptidase family protein n=1 Tax=Sphingomonas arenae TaxID=2812555 RepID=UPI001966F62E|nr:L,D-transpeptidase family protein [Sphingomonas arenae]